MLNLKLDHHSAPKNDNTKPSVAVVIPCYRVTRHVKRVIDQIGPDVDAIYAVDDACPENSGKYIEDHVTDPRVRVVYHPENLGVGGATMTGYRHAISGGADIIVKLDGDGQMDPSIISRFIAPIKQGIADYSKGNRFFDLAAVHRMPKERIFGNAVLSLLAKLSTGYWNLFDPTNGYTAIHVSIASRLPFEKISNRYFFETDMLFRLNTFRAVVVDVPMEAIYGDEKSNLKISRVVLEFLRKHASNFFKRVFYNYFLRDMSVASFELVIGLFLGLFGACFGVATWIEAAAHGVTASSGTVMLAALPIIIGLQFLLAFLSFDIARVPRTPLSRIL